MNDAVRCPFVRAVGEGRNEDAVRIAQSGPDPAADAVIPVLLLWALDAYEGRPVAIGGHS